MPPCAQRPRRRSPKAALVALAGCVLLGACEARAERRFAVLVANNDGGPDTRPLRYAHDDARRLHALLLRLGGVRSEDTELLLEKEASDLRDALRAMAPRIQASANAGESPVLILYFSGHARDGALRLGDTGLPLEEAKAHLARSAAAIRIGLFDACRSGALTRSKGARKAPAFDIDPGPRTARGMVLLTSSAADEDSQESDDLGASFFSHHLASGLMGSADRSGDGRVSLAEAYAYAYERTVADTAETAAGTQHPTFGYDLAGNGDVILTDVLSRHEGVVLPAHAPEGSWFLVDARGAVVAEIAKAAGVERRVALAPGAYRVKRRLPDRLRRGDVSVRPGEVSVLDEGSLRDAPFSDDPVKGLSRRVEPETRVALGVGALYQGFFEGPFPSVPAATLELALRGYLGRNFEMEFDLTLGGGEAELHLGAARLPYSFREVGLGTSLVKEWPLGSFVPYVGGRVGLLALSRTFEENVAAEQGYVVMTPALVTGLRWRLSDRWSASGRGRLHYLYYNVEGRRSLGYLEGAVVLSYEL